MAKLMFTRSMYAMIYKMIAGGMTRTHRALGIAAVEIAEETADSI
jgi:hypothetical protein